MNKLENEELKSDNEDMKMTLESNETEVTKLIDEFNLELGNLKGKSTLLSSVMSVVEILKTKMNLTVI